MYRDEPRRAKPSRAERVINSKSRTSPDAALRNQQFNYCFKTVLRLID